jgi:hypothetical protein
MSTSGSTSYNLTSDEIITKAFHRLGKASEGENLSTRMLSDGRSSLNLLLKSILGTMDHLFTRTEGTVTLEDELESYLLTPKAGKVLSVRLRYDNGTSITDMPLRQLSRQEYFDMPVKTSAPGVPNSWYYDPQRTTGTLYVWPAPASEITAYYSLCYTYIRRIEDMVNSSDDLDMPQEWLDPVVWMLADSLETEYPVNDQRLAIKIERKAVEAKAIVKSWDTEDSSIFLQPEYRPWPA